MARWFIPKRSKRGDRGIVSRLLGGVGEVLFYASLCLIGVTLLAILITLQVTLSTTDAPYYSIVGFCLRLTATLALIIVGATRSISTVWHASASVERRSALVDLAKSKEAKLTEPSRQYPAVPFDNDLTNSPGTELRYRLPCLGSPNRSLLGSTLVCLILLGIASVTGVLAAETIRDRNPDVLMIGVALASIGAAGWATYSFFVKLLRFTTIGPTTLEVSEHPLTPGQAVKLALTQNGRLKLVRLSISLVCFEEAIYQQGTNVRTERRETYRTKVFDAREVDVLPGQPFSQMIEFHVPDYLIHSFRSPSNCIDWAFVVRGVAVRWARFERSFPVVILPFTGESTPDKQ